jgi:ribosomal-protein-alanine N-acetyltransferase
MALAARSMSSSGLEARLDQLRMAARLRGAPAGVAGRSVARVERTRARGVGVEVLRTARLLLRPLLESDAREFARMAVANREHLARFMPLHLPGESDADVFVRQLAQCEAGDATGRDWRRIAFDTTGRMVGGFNINDIRRGLENRGELTMWVASEHSGMGYAGEALRAVVEHAFAPCLRRDDDPDAGLGLDALTCMIAPENEASIRLVRRAGFSIAQASAPIELILSGRPASHDEYVLFAQADEPEGSGHDGGGVRRVSDLPVRVRRGLRQVLRVESAARLRVF